MTFFAKEKFYLEDLPVIYEKGNEKWLADGSVLKEKYGDVFEMTYADGKVAEYRSHDIEDELLLTREETLEGRLAVYGYGYEYNEETDEEMTHRVMLYQRDEKGHYVYYQYKRDDFGSIGDLEKTVEGDINEEEEPELRLDIENLPVILKRDDEKILTDGSVLKEIGEDVYQRTYLSGKKAEYVCDYDGDELRLMKVEETDGRLSVYDYKKGYNHEKDEEICEAVKIYQRDENGHYVYNKYERDPSDDITDFVETVYGNIYDEYTPDKYPYYGDLPLIYKQGKTQWLADGSVLKEKDGNIFERTYPNGVVCEYSSDFDDYKLLLIKEAFPDGRLTIYDYNKEYHADIDGYEQFVVYQRDEKGHYVYNQYETDFYDDIVNVEKTVEGNIDQETYPEMSIEMENLEAVYERGNEKLLKDGSLLREVSDYVYQRKYLSGVVAYYDYDCYYLRLMRVEEPDGSLVIYGRQKEYDEARDEEIYHFVKIYDRDVNGKYLFKVYDRDYDENIDNLKEVIEGNRENWIKKTFYDEEENIVFYQIDGDDSKKYYPSGKLMEEHKNGAVFKYYETGVLKSEEYTSGALKEYAPNKLLLNEIDDKENYWKFKLNNDETGTLLVEKGNGIVFEERCEYDEDDYLIKKAIRRDEGVVYQTYYPDETQQIREEIRPDNTVTQWSKYGQKTYEKLKDGHYKYISGDDYQMFDKNNNLIEAKSPFGRTVYTYDEQTNKVKHIHKYNENGQENVRSYRHFDKEGKDDTKYYLARKKLIKERIKKEDEEAKRKKIERIKALKKISKTQKIIDHLKAMHEIKER